MSSSMQMPPNQYGGRAMVPPAGPIKPQQVGGGAPPQGMVSQESPQMANRLRIMQAMAAMRNGGRAPQRMQQGMALPGMQQAQQAMSPQSGGTSSMGVGMAPPGMGTAPNPQHMAALQAAQQQMAALQQGPQGGIARMQVGRNLR